jgi:hypothetical protein
MKGQGVRRTLGVGKKVAHRAGFPSLSMGRKRVADCMDEDGPSQRVRDLWFPANSR